MTRSIRWSAFWKLPSWRRRSGRRAAKLRAGLKDDDNAIRYWSALGLLMRGKTAVSDHMAGLRLLLKDECRLGAHRRRRALGQFGSKEDLDSALPVLLETGDPRKNSIYNSLAALNALDRLGEKSRSVHETLKTWPKDGVPANHRAGPGIARLLESILGRKL